MISTLSTTRGISSQAIRALGQAIEQAESGSASLASAQQETREGYQTLDGFQPAVRDIANDTLYRNVSGSARALGQKADGATSSAESSANFDSQALISLDGAIASIDAALPGLSESQRRTALQAREQLMQRDELWYADISLGSALAAINGGALPYIEAAQADGPGQDVSFTAGEIFGTLQESLGHLSQAEQIQGMSLAEVQSALKSLRELKGAAN